MNFYPRPTKLIDCREHGSDSELFIVEGDSASLAVARARDSRIQAVLPMQGKPINALKASPKAILANDLLSVLIDAIGAGWGKDFFVNRMRYESVILLFDPDADGIHGGALMTMFFYRWMPALIQASRLSIVRPPLYELVSPQYSDVIRAYSDEHFHKLRKALDAKGIAYQSRRFRGLASLSERTLVETCLDRKTRQNDMIGPQDALAAIEIFGGKRRSRDGTTDTSDLRP